jgi:pyruvate,water dikinase
MTVRDLRDGDACGGKATGLARLIRAGLRVPAGFVLGDGEPVTDAVAARAAALGELVAVRSSATIEDGDDAAAAGVFASRAPVRATELAAAVDAVRASARAAHAIEYARQRGAAGVAMAVIVQRYVAGARATVYTRPPGQPDADVVWVQRDHAVASFARDAAEPAVVAAIAAERAVGAARGADVELVLGDDDRDDRAPWIVQARPIVHRPPVALEPPPDAALAPLRDGRTWTWDVAHNPDPLSPAQQGLVARVAAIGRYEPRIAAGFLYYAPRGEPAVRSPAPRDAAAFVSAAEAWLARMAATLADAPVSLAAALDHYAAFYADWEELRALLATVPRARVARPSAAEAVLLRAARGDIAEDDAVAGLADLSPAWDVAVPTYGEQPQRIREAIGRARALPAATIATPQSDHLAAAATDLGERDDLLFARAQAMVRRAIRARGAALGIAPDDACWLPLDDLLAGAVTADPSGARAASARAARYDMPRVVGPGAATVVSRPDAILTGHGAGGRAVGRVIRFASLAGAFAARRGDVVVARAVTPALAVLAVGCAALVSETGGPLDHGASIARELGIPCVVGCTGAWQQLADGALVEVDGATGRVESLTSV